MTHMDCGEVRELLHAYEDDELPASERASVAGHLRGCADCAQALTAVQALRRRIRASGTFAEPAGLNKRVQASIGTATGRPGAPSWTSWAGLAASHLLVACLGALAAYAVMSWQQGRTVAARDVVAAHVRSLLGEQLVQIASTETHTVKPWFAGRVPFAPDVADLAQQGFPMIGGRVDHVLDRAAAAVVYGRRKHKINLFILPDRHAGAAADQEAVHDGYNIVAWRHDGFAYFAVSDLNPAELREMAHAVRRTNAR